MHQVFVYEPRFIQPRLLKEVVDQKNEVRNQLLD